MTCADDLVDRELMRNRFQRLIGELMHGSVGRTTFQPWEIELLIDIQACQTMPQRRVETLRQYLRAVEKQLDDGPGPPMKLSTFLQTRITRRPSMRKRPDSTMRIASE